MYETFGKAEVDKRVEEFKQGKKALAEPALDGDIVLLTVQTIPTKYRLGGAEASAAFFFDNSSTCSVIRNEFASKHKLYSEKVLISLVTVNGSKDLTTKLYLVELVNLVGNTQVVRAFGLYSICRLLPKVCYKELKQEFSPRMQEELAKLTSRPKGVDLDLLIGSESIGLHPTVLEIRSNVVAKRLRFRDGFMLNGTSPQLKTSNCLHFTEGAEAIRVGSFNIGVNALRTTQLRNSLADQDNQRDDEIGIRTLDLALELPMKLDPSFDSEKQEGPAHLGKEGGNWPNKRKLAEEVSEDKIPRGMDERGPGKTATAQKAEPSPKEMGGGPEDLDC